MGPSDACTRFKMSGSMGEDQTLLKNYWCNRQTSQPDFPIESGLQLSQVLRLSGDWFSAYRSTSKSMVLVASQVQIYATMAARLWLAAFYVHTVRLS